MLGWVASGLARSDPGATQRAAMQAGYQRHCRPSCWHAGGLRGSLLERKGSAAASVLVVGGMVALTQQLEVVAESWELVVRTPMEGSRDMEVARPGV